MYLRWYCASTLNEIYFVSQPSNQVDDSKSTRILSFMSGKETWSFRSEWEVERSTSRLSTNQRVQRIIWNRWRTNWVRVGKISRDVPHCSFFKRSKKIWTFVKEIEQFEGIILFMSMFNDIVWTKKWFREDKRLRTKNSARTLVIPRTWRRK